MWDILQNNLLWSYGQPIIAALAALAAVGLIWYKPLVYVSLAVFVFSVYFFRNPERCCQQALNDDAIIVCPSDGKVVDLQFDEHNGIKGYAQKVSIFLSPLDVHVNWLPTAGIVHEVTYTPGQFMFAFLPKSSELNEHNDVVINRSNGKSIMVRQIAGTVARRICCWVEPGQQIHAGDQFGMIRFGSRVDIFVPREVELAVGLGQRVYGGETVLGRWRCDHSPLK